MVALKRSQKERELGKRVGRLWPDAPFETELHWLEIFPLLAAPGFPDLTRGRHWIMSEFPSWTNRHGLIIFPLLLSACCLWSELCGPGLNPGGIRGCPVTFSPTVPQVWAAERHGGAPGWCPRSLRRGGGRASPPLCLELCCWSHGLRGHG